MGALILLIFIALLLLGTPLYTILFGAALVLLGSIGEPDLLVVLEIQKFQANPILSAIPLFTFAGFLLARSKTPDRVVNLFDAAFGFIPKANSVIVLIIMALFTALTGASGVSILAVGGLMLPLLVKGGRNESYSLGLITASGSIGLLFPPSLPVILFGIMASQIVEGSISIDTLYKVAFLPAIILIGSLIFYSYLKKEAVKKVRSTFNFTRLKKAIIAARYEIPIPIIIYGGIYSGIFTLTEAAIVTAIYVFIIEFFLYKDLTLKKDFFKCTTESMILAGGIFVIMASAAGLTSYVIDQEIPTRLFNFINPYITHKYQFLLAVNVFLLICGCFLDIFSAIIIVLPILLPLVQEYGISPYHFAVIFMVNLEIGYLTPPVGLNLFISAYRFKKRIPEIYKSSLPFLIVMLIILIIITYVPSISTFLLK